ncbi:MAG: NIPSNAP family protein [Pseudomonadota bacterium]|nr:NIPSNAP family protein [Pseudomonadota bacterium]
MAFYELRQYTVLEGQMENWLKVMHEEIIPFQVAKGMVIAGSFRGEEDDTVYVWIRRFENEAERERLYDEVYGSDYWNEDVSPRLSSMLNREAMVVTRLTPTQMSILQ